MNVRVFQAGFMLGFMIAMLQPANPFVKTAVDLLAWGIAFGIILDGIVAIQTKLNRLRKTEAL